MSEKKKVVKNLDEWRERFAVLIREINIETDPEKIAKLKMTLNELRHECRKAYRIELTPPKAGLPIEDKEEKGGKGK